MALNAQKTCTTVVLGNLAPLIFGVTVLWRIGALASMSCDAPVTLETMHAKAALALCEQADRLVDDERQLDLTRGLQLAEEAVAAEPCDARAHLAVFCNLGKQLQLQSVGLGQIGQVGRLKREIDIALALSPGDAEILTAKGALLLALPRVLGGDARQGEALLREALVREPANAAARHYLNEALGPAAANDDADRHE